MRLSPAKHEFSGRVIEAGSVVSPPDRNRSWTTPSAGNRPALLYGSSVRQCTPGPHAACPLVVNPRPRTRTSSWSASDGSQQIEALGLGSRWSQTCAVDFGVGCVDAGRTVMTTYALAIVLFLMAAVPASAQHTPLADSRWAPWLGCWRLVQDDRGPPAADTTSSDDVLVCVLPALRGSRRRHDNIRWWPIGRAADGRGRWNEPTGERAGVQRQSGKRVVAERTPALHAR